MLVQVETKIDIDIDGINPNIIDIKEYVKAEAKRIVTENPQSCNFYYTININSIEETNLMKVDYKEAGPYVVVDLLGRKMLWSDMRIDRKSIPNGIYAYDLRHEDQDWGNPCEIKDYIFVNFMGTVLTDKPIDFENEESICFDPEIDFGIDSDSGEISASYICKFFKRISKENKK